jgi:hypothetical protein
MGGEREEQDKKTNEGQEKKGIWHEQTNMMGRKMRGDSSQWKEGRQRRGERNWIKDDEIEGSKGEWYTLISFALLDPSVPPSLSLLRLFPSIFCSFQLQSLSSPLLFGTPCWDGGGAMESMSKSHEFEDEGEKAADTAERETKRFPSAGTGCAVLDKRMRESQRRVVDCQAGCYTERRWDPVSPRVNQT